MANWRCTIDFKPFYHDDKLSIKEKADRAVKELRRTQKLKSFEDDYDLDDIIEDFEGVSGDGEPTETTEFTITEDFDARMSELYDWADANRVWVATF